MKIILLISSLISIAHADVSIKNSEGGLVGNGGGLVVCYDSANTKITSAEVLDLYEGRILRDHKLDSKIIQTGDWKTIAQGLVDRVKNLSEMRYQLYSFWLEEFEKNSKQLTGVNLGDVRDAQFIAIPDACRLETAVIQAKPRVSGDPRYMINAKLWTALSEFQKAALVMHELIYREAISYGHNNSIYVRIFNDFLMTDQIYGKLVNEKVKLFQDLKFMYTDIPTMQLSHGRTLVFQSSLERIWNLGVGEEPSKMKSIFLYGSVVASIGECDSNCLNYIPYDDAYNKDFEADFYARQIRMVDMLYTLRLDNTFTIISDAKIKGMNQAILDVFGSDIINFNPRLMKYNNYRQDSDYTLRFTDDYIDQYGLDSIPTEVYDFKGMSLDLNNKIISVYGNTIRFKTNKNSLNFLKTEQLSVSGANQNILDTAFWNNEDSRVSAGCMVPEKNSTHCSLLVRADNQNGILIDFNRSSSGKNDLFFDSKSRYMYGGSTEFFITNNWEIWSPNDSMPKTSMTITRNPITDEFNLVVPQGTRLNDTDHTTPKYQYFHDVMVVAGTYPTYKNLMPKWINSDGDMFSCASIFHDPNYIKYIKPGDYVFFLENGDIDKEKTCGNSNFLAKLAAENWKSQFQQSSSTQKSSLKQ